MAMGVSNAVRPGNRAWRIFATLLGLGAALCAPVRAQEAGRDSWQVEFTPYVWGAGMSGKVRLNDRPQAGLTVEQSFSDVLKVLDFALMGAFEARKDRWAVLADGVYFKVSDKGSVTGALGFSSLAAQATITQQMYALAGAYRVSDGVTPTPVDVVGGLRAMSVKWDVGITASVPVLPLPLARFVQTKDWIDPFVGVRVQHRLDDRWSLVGYADIGGFGVGSKFSVQTLLGANYVFNPQFTGKFGYRYISNDYDKSGFKYDMANSGLLLGLGIRW
jgi:opacity protein-like surface antigen